MLIVFNLKKLIFLSTKKKFSCLLKATNNDPT